MEVQSQQKCLYITTPIYYANNEPHIGHLYTLSLADCWTMYQRCNNKLVYMQTGTDEHGSKVARSAVNNQLTPHSWSDVISSRFKMVFDQFNLNNYSRFIRTTDADHERVVLHVWKELMKSGTVVKQKIKKYYNVSDEAFVNDSELEDYTGDQAGQCMQTKRFQTKCELVEYEGYVFKATLFQKQLIQHFEQNSGQIIPNSRVKPILDSIKNHLQDLPISRDIKHVPWGIEVPDDSTQTIYVWLDALVNYLTGACWPEQDNVWPADFHIVGKEISVFHCIYWCALLLALNMPLPKHFLVHSLWLDETGKKIGKSSGNFKYINEIISKYHSDFARLFMIMQSDLDHDILFSEKDIILTIKKFDILKQLMSKLLLQTNDCNLDDNKQYQELILQFQNLHQNMNQYMEMFQIKQSIESLLSFMMDVNNQILNFDQLYQLVVMILMLLIPFLPIKSKQLLNYLNIQIDNLYNSSCQVIQNQNPNYDIQENQRFVHQNLTQAKLDNIFQPFSIQQHQ